METLRFFNKTLPGTVYLLILLLIIGFKLLVLKLNIVIGG